ncbi:MAG: hypothetical protein K940chlam9_00299 [Chlamydiae bacterium]|nr:hypothetical protein [Chlamydiota bacterium]
MKRHHRHYHHKSGGKSFTLGALVGGMVGGITALLFAPKPGKKMRKDIAKKYHDVSDKTQILMEDVYAQTNELIDKAKDIAWEAKEAASSTKKKIRRPRK